MKKLSNEQIQEIIALYQLGTSPKEIGEKLGIYNNSVTRILRKQGVERNKAAPRITPEQTKYIIEKYSEGISSEIIAKELNINSSTVLRILKRNNIQIRDASSSKRIYALDESLLDNIDSEEKAYFLGLMWSDGNIHKESNDIKIDLHSKDEDILIKLSNFFFKKEKLYRYATKTTPYTRLLLTSAKLKEKLINLGCIPNKTFKLKYPNISENLNRHFIRGLIDGDGSVFDYESPTISVTGTRDLLLKASEIIEKQLNIRPLISQKNKYRNSEKNIIYMEYRGFKKVKALGDWIYNDSYMKIHRKYNEYLNILSKIPDNYFSFDEQKNIVEKFVSGQSSSEISKELKENQSSIYKIIRKNPPFNYGSTDIISFEGNLLSKDYLSQCSLEQKHKIKIYLYKYFRNFGFPYPKYTDYELLSDWNNIKNFDTSKLIIDNKIKTKYYVGNNLFRHFFHNFYEVSFSGKISMLDAFNNDELLLKVIENRLGITHNENFNISGAMLRQGFRNSKLGLSASIFQSTVAKYIYDNFSEENGIVYDYSCGFGQRLIGAMASKNNLKYYGVEPWSSSFNNLNKLSKFLFKQDLCNIYNVGSENFKLESLKEKVCLSFSSPPYYDTEIYCNENTQCNLKSYKEYIKYWQETCSNINYMLKPGGYFIFNISEKYKFDLFIEASKYFYFIKRIIFKLYC